MSAPFAHVDGHPIASATIHVPWSGAWFADVVFLDDPALSGAVSLVVGDVTFRGTIDARFAGTRGQELRARIVGGAAGWGAQLRPKSYVNDQGIKARLVVEDAAREAGETLGHVAIADASLGSYYARQAGPASQSLEDVIGSSSWWVEPDGTTTIGTRVTVGARDGSYEVLEYDALGRIVTIGADDVSAVKVGSVLSGGLLDAPQTVRDLEIRVTPESVRFYAWTGQPAGARGRLEGALRSIIGRATAEKLFGVYVYRVARRIPDATGERLELQAVDPTIGLPDLGPTPMWPGVAGAHAKLTLGAEVLVGFINGDRTRPYVAGFVGLGGPGHTPERLDFGDAPTSYVSLADKTDALLGMLFDLLSGAQVNDPTTGLPIPGGLWTPAGTVADAGALKTAAEAIAPTVISSASSLTRSR